MTLQSLCRINRALIMIQKLSSGTRFHAEWNNCLVLYDMTSTCRPYYRDVVSMGFDTVLP